MNINATIFGEAIAFALLIWFCMHFIWPHLNKAIEERQIKIAEGLSAAERAHAELKRVDVKVAAEIKVARQQATEILGQAQQHANLVLEKARADAQAEIGRQQKGAQADTDRMVESAREQLRGQVAQLAVQGAEKILQREIDPTAHKALLDKLITGI